MGAWIMAGVTFREAARKKVLWMALAAGAAFLCLFANGMYFQLKDLNPHTNLMIQRQGIGALLMIGLYAVDLMAVVMTVLTSVDTLSGELASGTIQAVATKPISRWELVLGKWLGFVAMVTVYVALMVGGITAITYFLSLHRVGGVTATPSDARGSSDLAGVHPDAQPDVSDGRQFLHLDERRGGAGVARNRLYRRMDRTSRRYHPQPARPQCGNRRQPHHAERSPVAARRLRDAVTSLECARLLALQRHLRPQQIHDPLCLFVSRPGFRPCCAPFLEARLVAPIPR